MPSSRPGRIAVLSVHTSPLEQPGRGDAGGLNVYVAEITRRLAACGVAVEVFTRAGSSDTPPVEPLAPGVTVHNLPAGPFGELATREVADQLCAFAGGLLAAEAGHAQGWFDLVHSHYWLSGHVGRLVRDRWGVPLVHSAHTLGKVKDLGAGPDETPEPDLRIAMETELVGVADRLVASTEREAAELVELYGADPARIAVVPPGVDGAGFRPGDRAAARASLGLSGPDPLLVFVGRIQPHKGPDVVLRAAGLLVESGVGVQVAVVGAASGRGYADGELAGLVDQLGLADRVSFLPPRARDELVPVYRAADVIVMPSGSESFGLTALEAQACGTPVVATPVGGLTTAVADGRSGLLAASRSPADVAAAIRRIVTDPALAARLSKGAVAHAASYSWDRTVDGLLGVYAAALDRFATLGS